MNNFHIGCWRCWTLSRLPHGRKRDLSFITTRDDGAGASDVNNGPVPLKADRWHWFWVPRRDSYRYCCKCGLVTWDVAAIVSRQIDKSVKKCYIFATLALILLTFFRLCRTQFDQHCRVSKVAWREGRIMDAQNDWILPVFRERWQLCPRCFATKQER